MTSSERRTWEARLMRAAAAGEPGPDLSVAERAAVPAEYRVGFVRMWISELRDALGRA
mgnify:CR=1 FL=1